MGKQLNPLEKEFLIKTYRAKTDIPLNDFCYINNVSTTSMKKWIHLYDEGGLDALARQTGQDEILPEGVDRTEENYKRKFLSCA